jgi:hypothetical protein
LALLVQYGVGAVEVGAKPDEVGGAALPAFWARHCAKNCGQVSPFVVPAAFACFHSSPQTAPTALLFGVCHLEATNP